LAVRKTGGAMKFGIFQIAFVDVTTMPIDAQLRCRERYAWLAAHRSEVLEASVYVESRLDFLMCRVFVGHDERREALFRSFVLDPDWGSFGNKWKMLRGALEVVRLPDGSISEAERAEMFTALNTVMNGRNMFAHGDIFVDGRDFRVFMQHFEKGKKQTKYLDEDYLRDFMNTARSAASLIDRVTARLDELHRSEP